VPLFGGVRPSPGAETPVKAAAIKPFDVCEAAEVAAAEDGGPPPNPGSAQPRRVRENGPRGRGRGAAAFLPAFRRRKGRSPAKGLAGVDLTPRPKRSVALLGERPGRVRRDGGVGRVIDPSVTAEFTAPAAEEQHAGAGPNHAPAALRSR
jgi:hypothetical protein